MAGITSLGQSWEEIERNLRAGASGVQRMPDWERYGDLLTRLGAPVLNFTLPPHFTRKTIRTMGRVAQMAVRATEVALEDAGLKDDPLLKSGRVGVAYGSSTGSTDAIRDFGNMLTTGESGNINATTYIRMMGHTAAVNIGVYFGLQGRVIPTSSACTSGSQGIGYAYEAIRFGLQDAMVAGGGEELCVSEAAVFDTLYATSTRNDAPKTTPGALRQVARRPGDRRGRLHAHSRGARTRAGARRAHLRGDRRLRVELRRRPRDASEHRDHGARHADVARIGRRAGERGQVRQRARHRDRARRHRRVAGHASASSGRPHR